MICSFITLGVKGFSDERYIRGAIALLTQFDRDNQWFLLIEK
jgi:hypothetical protein